jgi:deoxyribodipyrimidine photo-lyase
LHFGQLSPQRVAWEVHRLGAPLAAKDAFLEELIVRRELAGNFCLYEPAYDSPEGFPDWAKKSIAEHTSDARKYCYSKDDFEHASTHDPYELDGRDPNGYAGIAWSIGGVHDRAWFDRPVYGKIRYMNASGCAKKFNIQAYIARWGGLSP